MSHVCSKCGRDEGDTEWGGLLDVSVVVREGEEGFAFVTQLLCDPCFFPMLDILMGLGFVDHRHGGINFLEDLTCCGGHQAYENCPTPTQYGQTIVQPSKGRFK